MRWILLALLPVIALLSAYLALYHPSGVEIHVFRQAFFSPDSPVSFVVFARDGRSLSPLPSRKLSVKASMDGKAFYEGDAVSGPDGTALVSIPAPADCTFFELQVSTGGFQAKSSFASRAPAMKTMLATDKPVYRPGETVRFLLRSLNDGSLKPSGGALRVELSDPRGNKLLSMEYPLSEFGLAAGEFKLADKVLTGAYSLSAGGSKAAFDVKDYQLPQLKLSFKMDKGFYAPGDLLEGVLHADYAFSQPAADAKVSFRAIAPIRVKVESDFHGGIFDPFGGMGRRGFDMEERLTELAAFFGSTDSAGDFKFKIRLPESLEGIDLNAEDASLTIAASVATPAGLEESLERELVLTKQPIRLELKPEASSLVEGQPGRVFVKASYADGSPAKASGSLNGVSSFQTSEDGLALVELAPGAPESVAVLAEDVNGASVKLQTLTKDLGRSRLSLLLSKSVAKAGESVPLEIRSSFEQGRVYLALAQNGQSLWMAPVDIAGHRASSSVKLPPSCAGTATVSVYKLSPDGQCLYASRLLQIEPGRELSVAAKLDKPSYRPGETAKLSLTASARDGSPRQAAFSVSALDSALFSLLDARDISPLAYFNFNAALLPKDLQQAAENALFKGGDPLAVSYLLSCASPSSFLESFNSPTYSERENANIKTKELALEVFLSALCVLGIALLFSMAARLFSLWLKLPEEPFARHAAAYEALEGTTSLIFASLGIFGGFAAMSLGLELAPLSVFVGFVVIIATNGSLLLNWHLSFARRPEFKEGILASELRDCVPAFYLANILGYALLIAYASLFHESSLWGYGLALFGFAMLGIAFSLQLLKGSLFKKVRLTTMKSALGSGLGCKARPYWYWAIVPFLSVFSIVCLVGMIFFIGLSCMMPFVCIIEKLGGDGGGSSSWSSGKSSSLAGSVLWDAIESKPFHFLNAEGALAERQTHVRRNFPETLAWEPMLVSGPDGKAELSFNVADAITDYKLSVSAGSKDGGLGSSLQTLKVFQDFFVEFRAPASASQGDELSLPVSVFNYGSSAQTVTLKLEALPGIRILESGKALLVPPKSMGKAFISVKLEGKGLMKLKVAASSASCSDAIERELKVSPSGKRVPLTVNGAFKDGDKSIFNTPAQTAETGPVSLKVFPSALAEIDGAIAGMLSMPHGCFEQTSSINYPNVMIVRCLKRLGSLSPEKEAKGLEFIQAGYQRLLSFESSSGGFSLYGNGAPELSLSAYALLQLSDMDGLVGVSPKLMERTRQFILSKMGPDGRWGDLRLNAYIAYALFESAGKGPMREEELVLTHIERDAAVSEDPYALALAANALMKLRPDSARAVMDKLRTMEIRSPDGSCHWAAKSSGVFHSWGQSADIETTALAVSAICALNCDDGSAVGAMQWLRAQRGRGYLWGSTQATVQALRAFMSFPGWISEGAKPKSAAHLVFDVNGVKRDLTIKPEDFVLVHFIEFGDALRLGVNSISVSNDSGSPLSYQLEADCYLKPVKNGDLKPRRDLEAVASYSPARVELGKLVSCKVAVRNLSGLPLPMGIVKIEAPPGFEIVGATVERLKSSGVASEAELAPDNATLYFREFPADAPLCFELSLIAVFPAVAIAPPVKAYPYYQPELEVESEPVILRSSP